MKTQKDAVIEFHETYGMPVLSPEDRALLGVVHGRVPLRLSLIVEELDELFTAAIGTDKGVIEDIVEFVTQYRAERPEGMPPVSREREFDLVGIADALGDLLYVINGMAVELGIPLNEVFDEIHRSNMSKLDKDGKPIYREDGKVLKGPNFTEPDIEHVLLYGKD